MKRDYVLRSSAALFAAAFSVAVVLLLFTPHTSAQTPQTTTQTNATTTLTFRQQIDALSVSLTAVGSAIASSTDITPEERLSLFQQLVQLSRAILALQRIDATTDNGSIVNDEVVTDEVLPEDVGLHQIDVQLDINTFEAVMVEYYLDDDDDVIDDPFDADFIRTTTTVQLNQPTTPGYDFEDSVLFAEQQIVDLVQQNTGITDELKIYRLTHMSARNPLRDQLIRTNSQEGIELANQFGKQTNIVQAIVRPGDNLGQVELISDQQERMVVEIIRRPGNILNGFEDTYVLNSRYYAPSIISIMLSPDSEGLAASETSGSLEEVEILQAIAEMMDVVPFSQTLRNPNEELLEYMVQNNAEYVVDSDNPPIPLSSAPSDCVDDADRLVLNDYVLQLLSGLEANYILHPDLVVYRYPVLVMDNVTGGFCTATQRHF